MQVSMAAAAAEGFKSRDAFETALSRSQPYFQTYEAAVSTAGKSLESNPEKDTLEEQITARIIPDQMWRFPMMMGTMEHLPGLDAATYKVLSNRIALAAINVDWNNSRWARHVLETRGWSAVLEAGHKSAERMWLLVQHADIDPVFQVTTLRQLEPLARSGKFSRPGYAMLDDRVMLATTGKQHYGSQLSCQNHHWAPYSLDAGGEDPKRLDARRAEMDLPSEAAYLKYLPAHC
ncbi:DUF6624 domain-containing protein [Gluconacetobacter sp. Hr-1-5]|uniref:DUF6624 domain-containing protein n=1 Tax=Gluconacetobacter sp. Hr-1-5 TaxID=3395370 RepID=UPI003B52521F